ncbi:hypothetical protein AYK20_02535 [Thermoplasmatales archaeon SG8-52-1]|nr:MAG: hypothetical protein AYK20_02535 [Thermoplasmatales archaeon SG8-52-1]
MQNRFVKIGLVALIIVLLIGITIVTGISSNDPIAIKYIDDSTEIIDENDDTGNNSYGNYLIVIDGPISKLITKVTITEGPLLITLLINRNLNRRFFRLSTILPKMFYPVLKGINFTVEFKRNVRNNSRFYYLTTFSKVLYDENGSFNGLDLKNATIITAKAHKIKVENFKFAFSFKRFQLIYFQAPLWQKIFNPARFQFLGFCDNVTIV